MVSGRNWEIDDPEPGDEVVVVRGQHGSYMLPTSIRRLKGPVRAQLHDLADIGAQIRHLEDHVEQVVPTLRAGGASWAQIGAALGVTGETARYRYRDLDDEA